MLLRRLGNKQKMAKQILQHFPQHSYYIEPFFGAGGMFFNKPRAKFNTVNDADSDVYNLFRVVSEDKEALEKAWKQMPLHQDLWDYWKKHKETDPIRKAIRFLFLSNFGFLGKPETLRYNSGNSCQLLYEAIDSTNKALYGVEFMHCDFRNIFRKIPIRVEERNSTFIYADPPYLGTDNNYESGFTEADSYDLFEMLQNSNIKWAMSEFDHPFILKEAKERSLNVTTLGSRRNIKNRRTEVLVTNYQVMQQSLF